MAPAARDIVRQEERRFRVIIIHVHSTFTYSDLFSLQKYILYIQKSQVRKKLDTNNRIFLYKELSFFALLKIFCFRTVNREKKVKIPEKKIEKVAKRCYCTFMSGAYPRKNTISMQQVYINETEDCKNE